MSYVELYNDEILDAVNIGKTEEDFNEDNGDYIKVEIYRTDFDLMLAVLYSNRLLLKHLNSDDYYTEEYHYHPENPEMGFCTKKYHIIDSISGLQPISIGGGINEVSNIGVKYEKQFNIFKSSSGEIYIKPNEILKLLKLQKGKYKIRIYFLRNIKSTLGEFLNLNKNNLIENGNFFAGLEATQTGDLDRSIGRNNFVMMQNPGFSNFVLEQDGKLNNQYDMRVTGITPNTHYIFSCWVAWNNDYDGNSEIVTFDGAGSDNALIPKPDNTSREGSWINATSDRFLSEKDIGGLVWYKVFAKVHTKESATLGSIRIHVGSEIRIGNVRISTNPFGRRYFTDLRLQKIENFDTALLEYVDKLKFGNN